MASRFPTPRLPDGTIVDAADWNLHSDNVNDLDGRLGDLSGDSVASRLSALDQADDAHDTRLSELDARSSAAGTGNAALGERITTVEQRTTAESTGNAALGQRVTALESTGGVVSAFGQWTDDGTGAGTRLTGQPIRISDIAVPIGEPNGCSLQHGTFTPELGGLWLCTFTVQYGGDNTAVRAIHMNISTAASSPPAPKYGLLGGPTMDAQSSSAVLWLEANQSASVYAAVWSGTAPQVWRAKGCTLTAVWLGP